MQTRMRLLLVEDTVPLAQTLALGLEENGFSIDLAFDGELGLAMAFEPIYDLIILDIMLPKMSGIDILGQLRKKENKVPVLMLTARGELSDRVKGLNTGADDYLAKPFDFEELLARIQALIRRSNNQASPLIRVGDLEINAHSEKVVRNHKPIQLTAKEYSLLLYLAYHQGKVVSRSEIVEHLPEMDSDSNLIDVHIRKLRQKIDYPFEGPLIQTIRGRGYLLGLA